MLAQHNQGTGGGIWANTELDKSHVHRANQLTRVPQRWLDALWKETEPVYTASIEKPESACLQVINKYRGHLSAKCTLCFVRRVSPGVLKATVPVMISKCEE